MPDPSLFGIGKAQWDLINGFANWFAAVGSFAAAFVALYIANRATKPSARVSVDVAQIIWAGHTVDYVRFRIVNTGDRPIQVNQIGWTTGLFRKRVAIQFYDETNSSPLPVTLSHGEEASWMLPLVIGKEPWTETMAKGLLADHPAIARYTLRGQFFASTGHRFQTKPDRALLKELESAFKRVHGGASSADKGEAK